jgi:hypothetical protein
MRVPSVMMLALLVAGGCARDGVPTEPVTSNEPFFHSPLRRGDVEIGNASLRQKIDRLSRSSDMLSSWLSKWSISSFPPPQNLDRLREFISPTGPVLTDTDEEPDEVAGLTYLDGDPAEGALDPNLFEFSVFVSTRANKPADYLSYESVLWNSHDQSHEDVSRLCSQAGSGGGSPITACEDWYYWDSSCPVVTTIAANSTHGAHWPNRFGSARSSANFTCYPPPPPEPPPCEPPPDDPIMDQSAPSQPLLTECNPGGGGGGGGGGYWVTVTTCWGYHVYTNGSYSYSVITGCDQYSYFVAEE